MTIPSLLKLSLPLVSSIALLNCGALPEAQRMNADQGQASSQLNNSAEIAQANQKEITAVPVINGLEHPWAMAWLPNGDILITERPGRLRIVRNGVLDPEAIAGVTEVSTVAANQLFASQQGGLLDIALHPRFEENRFVYFTYSHGTQQANRTRVARAVFDGETLTDWQVIFEVGQAKPGGQHFGSRLTWLPDETLLVSIGDGGNPPVQLEGDFIRQQAQNLASHLGKVIRINDDGTIPADNPFLDNPEAAPEIWSYGHRNIQGMVHDPVTQQVWATEHGSRGGDELNLIEKGKNYGWPVVSFSKEYSTGQLVAPVTSRPDTVDPLQVWTPAIAPSGLAIYNGDRHPEWQGTIFAGGLVDKGIRHLRVNENNEIISETTIPIGDRVRDIRQGPDGRVYVLTDNNNGQLLRLES
ncbi:MULTISPECIES: PQQ-dependent sugar dehydrogenase [unclassified Synechocystis]|uniref:PQQ-dependent sugar dehydrogenase n=1 Tax=unclassified Synechocystis TaxID=2640012 RepID=UPI000426A6CB|nr:MULTISPECIES: PQQ-dependent sugar dehydrogenase [unclassified Synechocystis]AIE74350.1 PQQ-dependent oxidoreductase, gdhB family [Synechocystis sp. PCC 6714]MCT0254871.1 PQQ-dependent sugar dehydrogenase [Synechocystis sp. CS-94]